MRQWATVKALAVGAALAAAVALWAGCAGDSSEPPSGAAFEPVPNVSVSNNTPGVAASLTVETELPEGHQLLGSLLVRLPADGWTIEDAPDGDVVGSGFLELDLDCDDSTNNFNFSLVRFRPPADEVTAWRAEMPGFMDLLFRADPRSSGGYEIGVTFAWDSSPEIVACTPGTFSFTADGTSGSGAPVVTNPSLDGAYTVQVTSVSQTAASQSLRDECVPIGTGVCPTGEQSR